MTTNMKTFFTDDEVGKVLDDFALGKIDKAEAVPVFQYLIDTQGIGKISFPAQLAVKALLDAGELKPLGRN